MPSTHEISWYAPAQSVTACAENERPDDGIQPAVCVIYPDSMVPTGYFPAGLALRAG